MKLRSLFQPFKSPLYSENTQAHLGRDPERAHGSCLISTGQTHSIL